MGMGDKKASAAIVIEKALKEALVIRLTDDGTFITRPGPVAAAIAQALSDAGLLAKMEAGPWR